MSRLSKIRIAFSAVLLLVFMPSFAADPSLHQVYQAAEAGNYREAQGMMDQVLRDHPNSAKAHFVEAELLAKQGKVANASAELATAERLEPGLTFARPGAIQELKARLSTAPASSAGTVVERVSPPASGFPWGLLAIGLLLIAAIIYFLRSRQQPVTVIPASGGYGAGPQPYGVGGVGPLAPPGGGMGSGILGGLATGAAVGAGMVAGEMLAHRMLDGGRHPDGYIPDNSPSSDGQNQYDMGGNDFGVADTSSWDDSSSGGGDDWS